MHQRYRQKQINVPFAMERLHQGHRRNKQTYDFRVLCSRFIFDLCYFYLLTISISDNGQVVLH